MPVVMLPPQSAHVPIIVLGFIRRLLAETRRENKACAYRSPGTLPLSCGGWDRQIAGGALPAARMPQISLRVLVNITTNRFWKSAEKPCIHPLNLVEIVKNTVYIAIIFF